MSTLRSASLRVLVVAAAARGEFVELAGMMRSGVWAPDDMGVAIEALLMVRLGCRPARRGLPTS